LQHFREAAVFGSLFLRPGVDGIQIMHSGFHYVVQVESLDFRISSVAGTYHDVACRETLDESMTAEKTRSPSAAAHSHKEN
jgi:hypothetical protein